MSGAEFTGDRRAIKHDRFQIVVDCRLQPIYKFRKLSFHSRSFLTYAGDGVKLPTSACAATAKGSTAETSESPTTSTTAKSSATENASAAHHSANHRAHPPATAAPAAASTL